MPFNYGFGAEEVLADCPLQMDFGTMTTAPRDIEEERTFYKSRNVSREIDKWIWAVAAHTQATK